MKKLQILIALSMISYSVNMFTRNATVSQRSNNLQEAAEYELDAIEIADEVEDLLTPLVQDYPEVVGQIIQDEKNLEANFESVATIIKEINKKVTQLAQKTNIQEIELARFAVELAHTQSEFKKAMARHRLEHPGKAHKLEARIKAALMRAVMNVQELQERLMSGAESTAESFAQVTKKSYRKVQEVSNKVKNSKAGKSVSQASAQAKKQVVNAVDAVNDVAEQAVEYVQSQLYPAHSDMVVEEDFMITPDLQNDDDEVVTQLYYLSSE